MQYAGNSGDLLPPLPPAEKSTASDDQAGQSSTYDGAGNAGGRDVDVGGGVGAADAVLIVNCAVTE